MNDHGRFPFARPNAERPLRRASSGTAKALVVGVYPSAFHVAWSPPPDFDDRQEDERRHPYIASLAVDVEPTVFWDGKNPAPADLLEEWKQATEFRDVWGTVRPGHNGPSGDGLRTQYLVPLGIGPDEVAMTDVLPWFLIKGGDGSQAAAIKRLTALNNKASLAIDVGELQPRPTPRKLVEIACATPRRESLRGELVETGAPLIVTLGQEALDAVRGVADAATGVQEKLAPDEKYGTEGSVVVDGRKLRWVPLAHPGLIRQSAPPKKDSKTSEYARRSNWWTAHNDWCERMRLHRGK